MTNEQIYEIFLKNRKVITAYFPYYVTGKSLDDRICYTSNYNGEIVDEQLRNIICNMILIGALNALISSDNKTAVEVNVDGLDFPIYLVRYDSHYYITKGINYKKRIPVYQIII